MDYMVYEPKHGRWKSFGNEEEVKSRIDLTEESKLPWEFQDDNAYQLLKRDR